MNTNKKAKVLYITSLGHSGSTLLDLLCGTIPNVFSVGEAHFLSWQLLQGEQKTDPQTYCSCGQFFDKCAFWRSILDDISIEAKTNVFEKPESFRFSLNRSVKRYNNSLVHRLLNKAYTYAFKKELWPIRKMIYWFYLPEIKKCWKLYDKTAHKTGCDYVVDSSKNLNRFLLLHEYRPLDVKLLILQRDVFGVVSSSHVKLTESLIKSRAYAWKKFYYSEIPKITKHLNDNVYKKITYEDLCQDHNKLRDCISFFLGFNELDKSVEVISPYQYHTIQGNPIRLLKKDLRIKYDERWRERLTKRQFEWVKSFIVDLQD